MVNLPDSEAWLADEGSSRSYVDYAYDQPGSMPSQRD